MCQFCKDIQDLEIEYPEDTWHGGVRICDECGSEYYEEYGGKIYALNSNAQKQHPELALI